MMCVAETDSIFNLPWNCSKWGVGLSRCLNSTKDATRECLQSGNWSEYINTSQCISPQFMNNMSANSSQNLENVLQVSLLNKNPLFDIQSTKVSRNGMVPILRS